MQILVRFGSFYGEWDEMYVLQRDKKMYTVVSNAYISIYFEYEPLYVHIYNILPEIDIFLSENINQ